MNVLSRFRTARAARVDAAGGVDAKDRRMTADLGLSPAEVEEDTYEYRQALQQAADTSRLEELLDEERRAEDIQVLLGTPFVFTLGLILAWLIELAGAVLVLRSLGLPAAHRVLPAIALTAALIGLTRVTVKATAPRRGTDPEPAVAGTSTEGEGNALPPRREPIDWMRFLLPAVYALLVVAIAVVRVLSSNAEEVPLVSSLSEAVLMVAVSVGPAFIAAWLEAKRAPAVELARRLATLRGRVKVEERRIRRAEEHLRSLSRRTAEWRQENARRRAVYSTEHERALAQVRNSDEAQTTPADPTQAR